MKKAKIISLCLLLVLCLGIVGVGVYAFGPLNNNVSGYISINASSYPVEITCDINGNQVFYQETVRSGIKWTQGLEDLSFDTTNITHASEIQDIILHINIKNKSNKELGAYFYNGSSSTMPNQATVTDIKLTDTLTSGSVKVANVLLSSYSHMMPQTDSSDADETDMYIVLTPVGNSNANTLVNNLKTGLTCAFNYILNIEEYIYNFQASSIIASSSNSSPASTVAPNFVKFKSDSTTIPTRAFVSNSNIEIVVIPSTITSIGANAFRSCKQLVGFTVSNGMLTIGSEALITSTKILLLTIPKTVTMFHHYATDWGYMFLYVHPENATYYSDNYGVVYTKNLLTAYRCSNREVVRVKENVTLIGERFSHGRYGVKQIILPETITRIESYAFYHTKEITTITLPNSLVSIGTGSIFTGCTKLTKLYYNGTMQGFKNITNYKNVTTTHAVICTDGTLAIGS